MGDPGRVKNREDGIERGGQRGIQNLRCDRASAIVTDKIKGMAMAVWCPSHYGRPEFMFFFSRGGLIWHLATELLDSGALFLCLPRVYLQKNKSLEWFMFRYHTLE